MKTTAPFKVYWITALLSFVMILAFVICQVIKSENWIRDVLLGLGTGGVSSTIVAFVIDLANTKKLQETEKKLFDRLTSDLDAVCEELLTEFVVGAQEVYGIDDEKRTFGEWATMLLGDDSADERILHEANYSLQQVAEVEKQARRLIADSRIHINNQYFDGNLTKKLKKIINYCQRIDREQRRGKYKNCLSILTKELVNTIIEYKPTMASVFKEPFKWDEE